jgi:hypothetical protein
LEDFDMQAPAPAAAPVVAQQPAVPVNPVAPPAAAPPAVAKASLISAKALQALEIDGERKLEIYSRAAGINPAFFVPSILEKAVDNYAETRKWNDTLIQLNIGQFQPPFIAWLYSQMAKVHIDAVESRIASHVASQERTLAQIVSGEAPELVALINKIVEEKLANAAVPPAAPPPQPAPDEAMVQAMQSLSVALAATNNVVAIRALVQRELPGIQAIFSALSPNPPLTATPIGRRDYIILSLLSILNSVTTP